MTCADDQLNTIVSDGIAFMKSITIAYGAEEGMKLWDTIVSTLDPSIKGKIFIAMLAGEYTDTIRFAGVNRNIPFQKINAIKEVRSLSGMGLIEAKIFVEQIEGGRKATLACQPKERANIIERFRTYGMIVS